MPSKGSRGTRKIGRNARTGRFATVRTARAKPGTHIVHTIRRSGRKKG